MHVHVYQDKQRNGYIIVMQSKGLHSFVTPSNPRYKSLTSLLTAILLKISQIDFQLMFI